MELKIEQVEELIESWFTNNEDVDGAPDSWFTLDESSRSYTWEIEGLGSLSLEDSFGGGEGCGEEMWVVVRVSSEVQGEWGSYQNTRHFKKNGFYSSFAESTWDGDFREVHRKQVVAIIYEEVAGEG